MPFSEWQPSIEVDSEDRPRLTIGLTERGRAAAKVLAAAGVTVDGEYQVHEADLTDSRFSDAKLTNVRFDDVNLQGSTFTNANLAGVRFRDVDLASATIEDANLTGMSINEALVTELIGVNRVHDSLSRSAGSPDANTGQTCV